MEDWAIVDVTSWAVTQNEPRGKRPKCWVKDVDGRSWLRKEPRESRPHEPAIESLALRLARAVGIDAPRSYAATWTESGASRRGLVVELFLREDEELSLGSVELKAAAGDYDPEKHALHTLERVRAALSSLELLAKVEMVKPFAQIVAFDAWIGNSDRHQENWGVIRAAGAPTRLAPMFDPAACLGVELGDGHRLLEPAADLATYLAGCPSGFGDGTREKPLLKQSQLLEIVADWPEWQANKAAWLSTFSAVLGTFLEAAQKVPADWLPPRHASLAGRLLAARLEWLQSVSR